MYAAISSAVRVKLESHFTYGPELLLKRRDYVLPGKAVGNEPKLWIFRRLRNRVRRVRNDKPARSSQHRLSVADKALVGVESRT